MRCAPYLKLGRGSIPGRIEIDFFVVGASSGVSVSVDGAVDLVQVHVEADNDFGQKRTSVGTWDADDAYRSKTVVWWLAESSHD